MHRTFSKLAIVGAAFAVLIGLSVLITGEPGSKLRVQPASKHHVGMVDDWSFHHLVFSNPGTYEQVAKDPAAYSRWLNIRYDNRFILQQSKRTATANLTAAMLRLLPKPKPKPKPEPPQVSMQRDWSVTLGGNVATTMYPAKYTWDVNATPDCTKDFAVYPVNATPSGSLANLVGLNNLYSASTGTNYCPGTGPSFIFAYEVGGGPIKTSPAISLDGTQVAFVESATNAVFHVLTRGTGTECGSPCDATHAVVPGSGASNAVDTKITMHGSVGVTLSSPFVDYNGYIAYVGDDNGNLHKFTGVFNGSPGEVVGGTPSWPIAVAPAGTVLTGPIYDGSTNIFVGGSDGNLYAVNASTGAVRMAVISGRDYQGSACSGKILDAPVVDSTLGTAITQAMPTSYSNNSCGGDGLLVQLDSATPATPSAWAASHGYALGALITDSNSNIEWCAHAGTSKSSPHPTWAVTEGSTTTDGSGTSTIAWVNVGTNPLNLRAMVDAGSNPSSRPLYAGTFDQAYFDASGKGGNFYYCALQQPALKNATFNVSTGNLQAGSGSLSYGGSGSDCGPLTEIYNANGPSAKDWLFFGVPNSSGNRGTCVTSSGCIMSFDITGGTFPSAYAQAVLESGGPSGIIIDNVFSRPLWVAGQTHSVGDLITDSSGNVQKVTACGTASCQSGSSAPTWLAATSTTINQSGGLSSSATTVTVTSTTGFGSGKYIQIDSEVILINTISGSSFNSISRGQFGTTGASHNNGATVYLVTVDNAGESGNNAVVWTNQGPNQTSSAYFGNLSGDQAVKLTQSALK